MSFDLTRRTVVGGLASSVVLPAFAQNLPLPSSPVTLNFVDVAGNLALTQKAIENYREGNPKLVSQDHLHQGAGAGTAGQDQGAAGRRTASTSTCVLTGTDALSAGIDQKLWVPIAADYAGAAAEARRHLSAGRQQDAGASPQNQGVVRRLTARPARCSNTCPTR